MHVYTSNYEECVFLCFIYVITSKQKYTTCIMYVAVKAYRDFYIPINELQLPVTAICILNI